MENAGKSDLKVEIEDLKNECELLKAGSKQVDGECFQKLRNELKRNLKVKQKLLWTK